MLKSTAAIIDYNNKVVAIVTTELEHGVLIRFSFTRSQGRDHIYRLVAPTEGMISRAKEHLSPAAFNETINIGSEAMLNYEFYLYDTSNINQTLRT